MSLLYSKVVFPISASLKAKYYSAENDSLFSGNNLIIFADRENYVPEYTYGSANIIKGINSYEVQNLNPEYVVNITVEDQRVAIRYLLEELILLEKADPYNRSLTTMYDYIEVEINDRSTGYTTRQGILELTNKGGTFRSNLATTSSTFTNGLSFKFTQLV